MRYIIDPIVNSQAGRGMLWLQAWIADYDLSKVAWLRVDLGRGTHAGVYGRCVFPNKRRGYGISCHVPGPYPCREIVRQHSIRWQPGEAIPPIPKDWMRCGGGTVYEGSRIVKMWIALASPITLADMSEGVVFVGAHEFFHFLRHERQVPGRNNEVEADLFAYDRLTEYRQRVNIERNPMLPQLRPHPLELHHEQNANID